MKTMKSILIATTLIAASAVSTLSAQRADAPAYQWKVAKGDSVKINPECTRYLTGEKPSTWVYDKVHTVGQLGTKRFPEGVLLFRINSWICEECLVPVNPSAQQAAPAPASAPAKAPATNKVAEEQPAPAPEPVPAPAPEPAPAPTPEPTPEPEPAPAPAPAPEPTPEPEPAPEAQTAEPAPAPSAVVVEQVKGDSVKSQQNFRNGYDRFTIGLRGGASSLMHDLKKGKWNCGGDVILDIQYAHYWTKNGRPVDLGIITGLGIGYSQSGVKTNVDSKEHVDDPDLPKGIEYTIKADAIKEHDGQLQVEIPLMFSLLHKNGLFFNFGPKFMMPVFTPFKQTISKNDNTYIEAYFNDLQVPVTNEVITGVLQQSDYTQKGSDYKNKFTINVMLGAEIGYEWVLKSGNSLGLGAYADYSVYNSFSNKANAKSLIEVQPPVGNDAAIVTVNPATKTYAKGLGFFDVGVKVAYHFNFPKKHKFVESKLF